MQEALSAQTTTSDTQNLSEQLSLPTDPDAPATNAVVLPEQLDATLNLSFKLDPSQWSGNPEQTRASVIVGDSFSVALPEGFSAATDGSTFDVFQVDDQGNTISIRIATARIESNILTVTFTNPVDTSTGTSYLAGASSDTSDLAALSILRASIDLGVKVDSSLVQQDAYDMEWTLQTAQDGRQQTASLHIPSLAEIADLLGISSSDQQQSTTPDASNALVAPLADEDNNVSYEFADLDGRLEMNVTWCDNNSDLRPSIEESKPNYIPQFSIDGGKTYYDLFDANGNLTSDAIKYLHISDANKPSWATQATVNQTAVNNWNVTLSGLPHTLNEKTKTPVLDEQGNPTYDDHGNPITETKTTGTTTITWQLVDKNPTPERYIYGANDEGPTATEGAVLQRYLMLTQEYTFTIVGKLGSDTLEDTFGPNFDSDHAEDFRISATVNNEPVSGGDGSESGSIANRVTEGELTVAFTDGGNTATITATLPMYTKDSEPIVYSITFNDNHKDQPGHDYYEPTYNNSSSPNHGSSTDALYDGGTMSIRPIGQTSYNAKKNWLDNNNDDRGAVTFTLWRYAANGSSGPAQAAPVQLNNTLDPSASTNSVEYVTITVPACFKGDTVDLGQLLRDKYGDAIDNLVKYDPDGYPYIYALREDTNLPGYEEVFGSVDANGNVTDTAPNYVDKNGKNQELSLPDRSNDPFIYNNGVVTNRLTGTVNVSATKTWEIAAFQDSLTNVKVTFTAQSRLKGSNDEWKDTSTTTTLDNWRAETLTQSFSGTFPKYDSQGRELEYRWIETNVTLDDQDTNFQRNESDDGGGSFDLQLKNVEGDLEDLHFTSTVAVDTSNNTSTITNTFSNVTDEHVDKYWQQPDGTLAQIKPAQDGYPDYPNLDTSGVVSVSLFQDGRLIDTFQMDGVTDPTATPINTLAGASYQETRSYHLDFSNLPKYDENGVRYTYLVLEDTPTGWHSERTYDSNTRTTRIDNTVGPGEGSTIRVTKDWVDGNDASHRLPVVFDLVATRDMQSQAKDEQGNPLYQYHAGDVVASNIQLSTDNSWFAEVDVPIGGLTYKDFKLVEKYLIGENGTHYPVVTKDNAETAYENLGIDTNWINTGWNFESTNNTSRVATPDHVYQVYATADAEPWYNDAMSAVSARNRRLGLLDLTVTKQWNDGFNHDRPTAELVLSCIEEQNVFSLDGEGGVWVQLDGGNRIPITDDEGNQLNKDTDNIRLEGNSLILTVNTPDEENYSEYHFFGLPKYDGQGNVVHYDVTEQWASNSDEYTSSKTVGAYNIGDQHFHDTQKIEFTNTRHATRNVTFYKHWYDHYVNDELSQRPDIYLTLYRVTVSMGEDNQPQYSKPEQVPGYINYLWQSTGEGDDPQYLQQCVISGLPAYDSNGNEYIYYASESMAADGKALDYAPVQFDYSNIQTVTAEANEEPYIKVGEVAKDDPQEDGTGYALHEGGTFENKLTNNVVAQGTKLWESMPGDVAQADLPAITIYLQQKKAGDQNWPELTFTKGENGSWTPGEGQVVAWTSTLNRVTTNQYSYTITHVGENGPDPTHESGDTLPRYDADGNLYEYRAIEVPWGLYGQPGGFDDSALGLQNGVTKDLSYIHDQESKLGVITIRHGATGSFLVSNIYSSDKGNLTVQKHFTGRDENDRYPNTTFDVYRYYIDSKGNQSTPTLVDSHTLTHDEMTGNGGENPVITANGANNTAQYTFTNLDIYTPNGEYWQYYVVEHGIDGYTTTVGIGDLEANSAKLQTGQKVDDGTSSGDLCPTNGTGTETKVTDTVIAKDDTEVDVTFQNHYVPDTTNLSGTKTWDDYNNAFNTRPSAEEFQKNLTVTRIGNGTEETLKTQSDNPDEANYFKVVGGSNNTFTITLNNVEKWAPDGNAWQYRITENLSGMTIAGSVEKADSYYNATTGSSTVSANTSNQFKLENTLKGQAAVTKNWVDGNDPYGLRPTTVTVRLQARLSDTDDWQDAWDLLNEKGYGEALTTADITSDTFTKTLDSTHGWKASWTGLPVGGVKEDGASFTIQYRVVEIKIGEQEIDQPTAPVADDNEGKIYSIYHPYQPTQEDSGNATDGFSSTITNTLEGTKISATKTWKNDSDWATRPGSSNSWSVTYKLQRKTENQDWEWVVTYGAEPATSPRDPQVISETITGSSSENSGTVTWDNLPQYDTEGNKYEYRVVEEVPGSYDVEDGEEVATATDGQVTYRYYAVDSQAGDDNTSTQSYTNTLRTVTLKGTKAWSEDADSSIIPDISNPPQMSLYRVIEKSGRAELVKMKNGTEPQPTWIDNNNGTWTFTYENLPAADKNNNDYTYYAEEKTGAVSGFYPLYTTKGSEGTDVQPNEEVTNGTQTGTKITNQPTMLTLAKVSDFKGDTTVLTNIKLSVLSKDGSKTYAVWTNGDDGKSISATTWVDGDNTKTGVTSDKGLIVGLPAGDYIVRETGDVPEGYAKAQDVALHINANGTATVASGVTNSTENGVTTINVTVTDPVLRGHLQLTKYVSDDGTYNGANAATLQGVTFNLYREDMDGDGEDELIASDLTTNAQGVITTVNNQTAIQTKSTGGEDLTYGGKYTKLSDGLPAGTYYFKETNTTPDAVMPNGDDVKSDELEITQSNHYDSTKKAVSTNMGNKRFKANVTLHKFDSLTQDGIEGATFKLSYTPEGSSTATTSTYTTGSDGSLKLENLKKGSYVLTEESNTGYVANGFRATFTIDDADADATYDIKSIADGSDIGFTVTSGDTTFTDGKGIPNTPERGTLTLAKTDENGKALNGATFRLEVNTNGQWNTVVENLVTGQTYKLNDANNGIEGAGSEGTEGQIKVTNMLWGEYRFVETSPAPGYIGVNKDGSEIVSNSLTINRNNLNASLTGNNALSNEPTSIEINKQSDVGQALAGAEFEIAPVDGTFADGSTDAKTITTDGTGLAKLNGQLVVGTTYTVFESKGPSGYDPADGVLTIKVANNGDLEVVGNMPDRWTRADLNHDNTADDQFSFMVTNYHMDIQLMKVSAADGTPLNGATFTLTGHCMDNNTSHTYTTGDVTSGETTNSGIALINAGLMGGVDYTLSETQAPAGYVKMTSPLKFRMDERGEITPIGEVPEGWTIEDNKISLTAENVPVELQITKLSPAQDDGTPGKALAGATFSITPANGSTFADGSTDARELTTNDEGKLNMTAQLVVGSSYDITEVSAPEGYERVAGTMRINVATDGSLSVVGSVDADGNVIGQLAPNGYSKVADNSFEVQVTNEPIEIGLVKVDGTDSGTMLEGAQFEITGVFAGQAESETRSYTTDANGKFMLNAELKSGETYTLHESAAPAGYELINGELSFSVAEDGTIAATGDMPSGYSIEQGNVTIVAADEPLLISLAKVDTNGDPLAGAQFRITPDDGTFPDGTTEKVATSSDDGSIFSYLMVAGSAEGTRYTVSEVAAPARYEMIPSFDILVFEDGSVQFADGTSDAILNAVQIENSENGVPVVTVSNTAIEASMSKVSTNGSKLTGAVFEVSGTFADGGAPHIITFDDNSSVALEGLVAGETYTVRETKAPEGYDLIDGEWSFTVQNDGTLTGNATGSVATLISGGEAGYFVSDDGLAITAVDAPTPPSEENDNENSKTFPFIPKTGDPTTYTFVSLLTALAIACIAVGLRMARKRRS